MNRPEILRAQPIESRSMPDVGQRTISRRSRLLAMVLPFLIFFDGGAARPLMGSDRVIKEVPQRNVVDRLSGFDAKRLETSAQWLDDPTNATKVAEIAKLLFQVDRLAKVDIGSVLHPSDDQPTFPTVDRVFRPGDVVNIRGRAVELHASPVPPKLVEYLEFDKIYRVLVETSDAGTTPPAGSPKAESVHVERITVLTTTVPKAWLSRVAEDGGIDHLTAFTGVTLVPHSPSHGLVLAASGLAWLPTTSSLETVDPEVALLARRGFDISLLEPLRRRDKKPLLPEDQLSFYEMLRVASEIGKQGDPAPPEIDAGKLLRNATSLIGRRVSMTCQSVRLSRIGIPEQAIRQRLGSDHYWQIDAIGELGNLTIRIDPIDPSGEPVVFENRYPVSIAALHIPDWLRLSIDQADRRIGARNDVVLLSQRIRLEGLFYRLWSYESDRMRNAGGAKQVGPLLMASKLVDRESPRGDLLGVNRIGYGITFCLGAMTLAAILWIIFTSRADAAARAKRRASS